MIGYYVFRIDEDGDMSIHQYDKETLIKDIECDGGYDIEEFNTKMPEEPDPNYWKKKLLLIKGEIITPKPKEKIVEVELE